MEIWNCSGRTRLEHGPRVMVVARKVGSLGGSQVPGRAALDFIPWGTLTG